MATTTNLNDIDMSAVSALVQAVKNDPSKAATVWKADVYWKGGCRSEAAIREFKPISSDEPGGMGGTDVAPNPVEQVAAALGNCLTVGYVAALTGRGIAIRDIVVTVSGQLDLRPFLGLAPGHAGFSQLDVAVKIDSDADARTLQEVHAHVVSTSPVGNTLSNPVKVDVRLTD